MGRYQRTIKSLFPKTQHRIIEIWFYYSHAALMNCSHPTNIGFYGVIGSIVHPYGISKREFLNVNCMFLIENAIFPVQFVQGENPINRFDCSRSFMFQIIKLSDYFVSASSCFQLKYPLSLEFCCGYLRKCHFSFHSFPIYTINILINS